MITAHSFQCNAGAQTYGSDLWLSSTEKQNSLPEWWSERLVASAEVEQV